MDCTLSLLISLSLSLCISHSDDIIVNALKSLNDDPEMYYVVVETLWELLKLGQDKLKQDKRYYIEYG